MKHSWPFALLLAAAIAIAAATLVESGTDSLTASRCVYGAWWFVGLWGAIVAGGVALAGQSKLWRRPSAFLLHAAFVVILAGALTTHLTGEKSLVHLREGETYQVPGGRMVRFDEFAIIYDRATLNVRDYKSTLTVMSANDEDEPETMTLSLNRPLDIDGTRLLQTSYDLDLRGTTLTANRDTAGTAVTYTGYALLLLASVWLLIEKRWRAFAAGVTIIVGTATALGDKMYEPQIPILRSAWLASHVLTIVTAYAIFIIMAVCSIIYLICRKEWTTRLNRRLLYPATLCLAIGIFIGAVWANRSWGSYWSWDAKESWALISMMCYGVAFHQRSLPWLRNSRNFHIYLLFAFSTVVMTYFGVNYVLGGMHSYAN